jgi:periplasmic protein TonB
LSGRWHNALRWCACFGIALGIHAAGAAALMTHWNDNADSVANAPVIMLELAAVAVAPQTTPTEVPPDQVESRQQIEPDTAPEKPPEVVENPPEPEKPVEKAEPKPEPEAKAEVATLPPPKPPELEKPAEEKKQVKKKLSHRVASIASAPSVADQKADRAAAPAPGANTRDPDALRNWTSQLVAQIERHKRYPADARGASGTAVVSFSVDRSGSAHRTRVVRSSGDSVLDHDAVAWVERSQPLPPPPADRSGSQFPVVVPLRYNSR